MDVKKSLIMMTLLTVVSVSSTYAEIEAPAVVETDVVQEMQELKDALEVKGIILNAQVFNSTDERINYLITKGNELLESNDLDGAQEVADFVLTELNQESPEAKALIARVQELQSTDENVEAESVETMNDGETPEAS